MGFNRCPFQLQMSYKNTKIMDRNVAPCSRPTSNVIGPFHEWKKGCPYTKALLLSGIRAWIKQGQRKRKKRDRKDRGKEADGKKGSPTNQKPIWWTKTRLPRPGPAQVEIEEWGTLYFIKSNNVTPCPQPPTDSNLYKMDHKHQAPFESHIEKQAGYYSPKGIVLVLRTSRLHWVSSAQYAPRLLDTLLQITSWAIHFTPRPMSW